LPVSFISCAFGHVDNLGAYTASRPETGLLIPSVLDSHRPALYLLQMTEPHCVFVILDRDYGQRLTNLAQKGPVWIVDTLTNRTIAQELRAADSSRGHLKDVTTFKFLETGSSEDILINELNTIDLHHGTYSANPPYTVIEVLGAGIREKVKSSFADFGFNQFIPMLEGFRAIRPLPKD
jgi:hypothetical protein